MRRLDAFLKAEFTVHGFVLVGVLIGMLGDRTPPGSLLRGLVNLLALAWMGWVLVQGALVFRRFFWRQPVGCGCRLCEGRRKAQAS